ncbi:MAG: hypothetical protein M9887_06035 [Chitinophagales bacterium]|nr:hypothetical protein [Chitinophagales bacterium]
MQVSKNIYNHKCKIFFYIGLVCYSSLLVISATLYKERIIQPDNSAYLFEILNSSDFVIAQVRRIAIFPQIPSVIATKIGMSLRNVGILFSAGYTLYYFLIYMLLGTVLKKYKFALVLLLLNILIVSHTFYWFVSELPLGIAALILLVAIYENRRFKDIAFYEHPILLVSMFLIITSHPLTVFAFAFTMLYSLRMEMLKKDIVAYLSVISIILYIAFRIYYENDYETNRINALQNIFVLFPNYINIESNIVLVRDFINYTFAIAIWVMFVCYYLKAKKYFDLLWINVFLLSYLFIINVSFYDVVISYYFENMYGVITLALSFIFVFELLPKIKQSTLQIFIFVAMCTVCFIRIFNYKDFYNLRIHWLRNYIEKQEYRNVALPDIIAPKDTLLASWAVPYDAILLSSLERGETYSIVFISELDSLPMPKPIYEGKILTGLRDIPYNKIAKRYFNFEESPYHVQYNLYE